MKKLLLVIALATAFLLANQVHAAQPDVIVIMADDLSAYSLDKIKTPKIDALAARGVTFPNAYGGPLCIAARTTLLAVNYAARFGVTGNDANPEAIRPSIGNRMQAAGYHTAMIGKWGLGNTNPLDFGFDEFYGFERNFPIAYYGSNPDQPLIDGRKEIANPGYITNVLAREAIRVLNAPGGQPVFVYLAMTAAHEPFWPGPETQFEKFVEAVEDMDRAIGQVIAATKPDTLIIFTADNGASWGSHPQTRGGKGTLYEGGIAVPMIVSWPGHLPFGGKRDSLVSLLDIGTTALAAAGRTDGGLPGLNLAGFIPGPRALTFDAVDGKSWAVRRGDWKLIAGELYNLENDPAENRDLADALPGVAAELRQVRAAITGSW